MGMGFRQRGRRTQHDWEAMAQKQIDDTQICSAYDIAQKGLQYFPQSLKLEQISARALARTGAFELSDVNNESAAPERREVDGIALLPIMVLFAAGTG
jgi:hypothetical protein